MAITHFTDLELADEIKKYSLARKLGRHDTEETVFSEELYRIIRELAARKNLSWRRLIRKWVSEKVAAEEQQLRFGPFRETGRDTSRFWKWMRQQGIGFRFGSEPVDTGDVYEEYQAFIKGES